MCGRVSVGPFNKHLCGSVNILQLGWTYPADGAGVDQRSLSCGLLVSAMTFLLLCCLFGILLLGLNLLLPASHGPELQPAGLKSNIIHCCKGLSSKTDHSSPE